MPEWLTVAEASAHIGIPKNRIYADFKKGLDFSVNDRGVKIVSKKRIEKFYSPYRMMGRYAITSGDALLGTQAAIIAQQEEHIGTLKEEVVYLKEQIENYIVELRNAHEEKTKILYLLDSKNK